MISLKTAPNKASLLCTVGVPPTSYASTEVKSSFILCGLIIAQVRHGQ